MLLTGSKAASKLKSVFGGKHVDVDVPHVPKSDGRHSSNKRADADADAWKSRDQEKDKQLRWKLGTAAIKALPAQSRSEITFALTRIKATFGFDSLKPVDVGNHWQVSAIMRNATTIDVPEKQEEKEQGSDMPSYSVPFKLLTKDARQALKTKLENRTLTKEDWKHLAWHRRFSARRARGVAQFWKQERDLLRKHQPGTRN